MFVARAISTAAASKQDHLVNPPAPIYVYAWKHVSAMDVPYLLLACM
jgi:hypothetical protein